MFDGTEGDDVICLGDGFGASVLYIDVGQCKSAGDFAQEDGLLVIGFDEGKVDAGSPEFYRNSGESCA
jgi:hypothetical protein